MGSSHKTSAIRRPAPAPGAAGGGGGATRTAARRAVRTPRAQRRSRPDRAPAGDQPLLGDLTRPIRADRRIATRRFDRWVLALVGVAVLAALLAALFVLPVQAWLRQEDDLAARRAELAVLERANAELTSEVLRLQTDEGAKEAAREELGLVDEGEIRVSVLPSPGAPVTLPAGFPYDAVTQIVAVRSAPPAAPAPAP